MGCIDMARKKRKMFKPKSKYDFSAVKKICDQYGAKLLVGEFTFSIKFKDGKELMYAIPYESKSILDYILSGIHGRVIKDDHFIGYAPKQKSLDSILVAVDLMV